jgi:pimeloyl-ACP methyl ester carboxylesterase
MASYVLIHGGCHGAWCWGRVPEQLRTAGHSAVAIDLPGRGDDASRAATVTLEDYIERVATAVEAAGEPVILVGHSMGGVTSSAFSERRPDSVARLVFLSAIVPADGEAGLPLFQEAGPDSVLLADGAIVIAADGSVATIPPEFAIPAFYERCSPQDVGWATPQLCPEPLVPLMTPLTLTDTGFGTVAKTYIGATDDRTVPPAFQRRLSDRAGAELQTIDSDHSPFLSATDQLVAQLTALA